MNGEQEEREEEKTTKWSKESCANYSAPKKHAEKNEWTGKKRKKG